MADEKKFLDGAGLDHMWDKMKSYFGNNYAAKSHTHTADQITDLDSKFGVNLIEKRVVTTSGAVSIPAGTRAIAYVGIGGGGGGGAGGPFLEGSGGGGGSGSVGNNATVGAGGAQGTETGGSGTVGGSGGKGIFGFVYNFNGLTLSAVIGAGGAGGSISGGVSGGGTGGNTTVSVSGNNAFFDIIEFNSSPRRNGVNGNAGNGGTGGAGGAAASFAGVTAGAGGRGGDSRQNGSAGGKGALIFFFYS